MRTYARTVAHLPGLRRRVAAIVASLLLGAAPSVVRADDLPPPKHIPGGPPAPAPAPSPPPAPAPKGPAPAPPIPEPPPPPGPTPTGPAAPAPGPPEPQPVPPAPPPSPLPAPGHEAEPRIMRIEFVGNETYGTESLKVLMRLKEGSRLDRAALESDTELLYRYFREVRIEQLDAPGGIALRITVSENPLVAELVINGLEEIKREEIEALPIRTKVGFPLFPRDPELDREDIIATYKRKGFHYADVSVTTNPKAGGGVRVVFTVVEGPKVKVQEVIFEGATLFPRKKLMEVMQTKPGWLLDTKLFVEEELRADLVEIRKLYRGEGYLDAEAVIESLQPSADHSHVVITIAVEEGAQYTVGNVEFLNVTGDPGSEDERILTGPGAMPPEDRAWFCQENLRSWLGLVPGQVYSGKTETKGRDAIREEYFRRSYLDARVEAAQLRPRAGGHVVDVHVTVIEGRKQRVARVVIVGNEFTRDKVLRRDVRQEPGGYVDRNELDRGLSRLRATRFFERVSRRIEDVEGPDGRPIGDLKDVVYEVSEGKTGKLTLGVSLSSDGGVGANVRFDKRNFDIARPPTSWDDVRSGRAFTGAGQTFALYLAPSTVNSSFGVDFGEPHVLDSDWGVKFGIAKRISFRETYTEDTFGYNIRVSRPIIQRADDRVVLFGTLQWRHEMRDIDDIDDDSVPGVFLFSGPQELHGLALVFNLHTVDELARPNHKTDTVLGLEYMGGVLGGDIDMWKVLLRHDNRFLVSEDDLGRRSSLTFRVVSEISGAFDDTPEVPPYERAYAGGRDTLRGFAYRGVGPHANGHPMGGEFLLAGSVEYEHPIFQEMVSGVVFADAGTLGTSIHDDDAFLLRLSLGFGLRIKIPGFGDAPLAIDFAYPLVKQDDDDTTYVSFSLARDF